MKRCLFNALAGVSLLLCVAVCALWVRSYWVSYSFTRYSRGASQRILNKFSMDAQCGRGSVCVFLRWDMEGPVIGYSGSDDLGPDELVNEHLYGWDDEPKSAFNIWAVQQPFRPGVEDSGYQHHWAGFGFQLIRQDQESQGSSSSIRGMTFPLWPVAALSLVLPSAWFRRKRKLLPGLCKTCCYDLRATSARCPECGTAFPSGQPHGSMPH